MHTYIERPKIPGVNLGLFYANNALEELTLKSVTEDTLPRTSYLQRRRGVGGSWSNSLVQSNHWLQFKNLVTLPIGC
jgi:hypothetical protein